MHKSEYPNDKNQANNNKWKIVNKLKKKPNLEFGEITLTVK